MTQHDQIQNNGDDDHYLAQRVSAKRPRDDIDCGNGDDGTTLKRSNQEGDSMSHETLKQDEHQNFKKDSQQQQDQEKEPQQQREPEKNLHEDSEGSATRISSDPFNGRSNGLLSQVQRPCEIVQSLHALFYEKQTVLVIEELVSDFGFDKSVLKEAIVLIGAFNVIAKDARTNNLVWNGLGCVSSAIEEVLREAPECTKSTRTHLARRILAAGYVEITTPKRLNPWSVDDLIAKYEDVLRPIESKIHVEEVVEVFHSLKLVTKQAAHIRATNARQLYLWSPVMIQAVQRLAHRLQPIMQAWYAQRQGEKQPEGQDATGKSPLPQKNQRVLSEGSIGSTNASSHCEASSQSSNTTMRSRPRLGLSAPRKKGGISAPFRVPKQASTQNIVDPVESTVDFPSSSSASQASQSSQVSLRSSASQSSSSQSKLGRKKFRITNSQDPVPIDLDSDSQEAVEDSEPSNLTGASSVNKLQGVGSYHSNIASNWPRPSPRSFKAPRQVPRQDMNDVTTDAANTPPSQPQSTSSKMKPDHASSPSSPPPASSSKFRAPPPPVASVPVSYLDHSLPVPEVNNGQPASCAVMTRKTLTGKPLDSGDAQVSIPTPAEMLRYQITCLRAFMARYAEFYSKATGKEVGTLTEDDANLEWGQSQSQSQDDNSQDDDDDDEDDEGKHKIIEDSVDDDDIDEDDTECPKRKLDPTATLAPSESKSSPENVAMAGVDALSLSHFDNDDDEPEKVGSNHHEKDSNEGLDKATYMQVDSSTGAEISTGNSQGSLIDLGHFSQNSFLGGASQDSLKSDGTFFRKLLDPNSLLRTNSDLICDDDLDFSFFEGSQ